MVQRRLLAAVIAPILLGVVAVDADAMDTVRGLRHPRDAARYADYVDTYVGRDYDGTNPGAGPADRAWVEAHPAEALAAGDAACRWLQKQPRAPKVDPTHSFDGPFTMQTVLNRFADTPLEHTPLSRSGRATLAAGAWEYLCWVDRAERTAAPGLPDD